MHVFSIFVLLKKQKNPMFNNLSEKLDKALHTLKGHGKITEVNVAETLKEVRRALLDADVNFKIAKEFTKRVQNKAIGQDVLTTLNPGQLMVKLVKDELTDLMGGDVVGINLGGNPTVILMSGLQGSGKTTFSGKLANFLKNKNTGSVSATQNTNNLNKDNWTSNFVCLKSCYGTESIKVEKNFSSISSEFCIISKELFNNVGKWKALYGAGGEEFDLGYKIRKLNKKNIKLKSAAYSGFWCGLTERSIRIINRTEKYIPILLKKKTFDSKGTFATSGQAFSAFLTLFMLFILILNLFLKFNLTILGIFTLFIIQLMLEIKFLIFAYKKYKIKMLLFSLFGIQVINLSIILGGFLFLFKNTFGLFFNYSNK